MPQDAAGEHERERRAELPGARGADARVVAHPAARPSRRSSRATASPASASSSTASAKRPGSEGGWPPIRVNSYSSSPASVQPQRSSARPIRDVAGAEVEHVPPDGGERLGAERGGAGRVGPEAEVEQVAGCVAAGDRAVGAEHRGNPDRVVGAAAQRADRVVHDHRVGGQPEPLPQLGAQELEVLGVVGAGQAEPRGGEVGRRGPCARERRAAGGDDLVSAASGVELWMSAVPPSPVPSTMPVASVTSAWVFVLPPSTPRRSVPTTGPLGRPQSARADSRGAPSRARRRAAPRARAGGRAGWRRALGCRLARSRSRPSRRRAPGTRRAPPRDPRTCRGSGRAGSTSMPPRWQRPSTSTTRSSGKPGSAPPAFGTLTGCTSSLSLKIASITSIASSSSWMPPREREGSSCGSSLCACSS